MDVEVLLPKDMMRKSQLYPLFKMGKALTVAVADPFFLSHLSDVRFATELMPEPVIVEYSKLQSLINPNSNQESVSSGMSISSDAAAQDMVVETSDLESEEEDDDSGVDVTQFLNELLMHMVGEIRDLETAEISVKAAQTGHLLLSTLHTNSAPETLTRLINMGVPAFNIASAVHLIVAQRLARRLCKECKALVEDVPKQALVQLGFDEKEVDSIEIFEPVGCGECSNGYKGRVGIYQVMPISTDMQTMIMNEANSLEIAIQAKKEKVSDLRQSALAKVREGITSLAELERVTKD